LIVQISADNGVERSPPTHDNHILRLRAEVIACVDDDDSFKSRPIPLSTLLRAFSKSSMLEGSSFKLVGMGHIPKGPVGANEGRLAVGLIPAVDTGCKKFNGKKSL
jgi:hypothetical protein